MLSNFFHDLNLAKAAEQIVENTISSLAPGYQIFNVSDDRNYYKKGDLLVITPDRQKVFVEVKDDSRIGDTQNILCEEKVWYYQDNQQVPGNFYSDYEIYAVVSKQENAIYFFNFATLKSIYKTGRLITIKHWEQESDVYLLPVADAIKAGALIAKINYETKERMI